MQQILPADPLSSAGFLPARNPAFSGHESDLDKLRDAVVKQPGVAVIRGPAGSGKTTLACEFANRFARDFDAVFWIHAGSRSLAELTGEIGAQMHHRMSGDAGSNLHELSMLFEWKRYLLVVDHVTRKCPLVTTGQSSTIITTRMPKLMPSASGVKLPKPGQLDQPIGPIVAAMAVCSPAGFPYSLAAEIAGVEPDGIAHPALALDPDSFRCTLSQYIVDGTFLTDELRFRHAQAVSRHPATPELVPDMFHAFRWTLSSPDHWELCCELARNLIAFTQGEGRVAEAFEVMELLSAEAEKREDWRTLNRYARERVYTLQSWNRDAEAKALEKKSRRWQFVQLTLPWDAGWQ